MSLSATAAISPPAAGAGAAAESDVCIIVEGCYPYVAGGVSSWIDWLMKSQPGLTFCVTALWPRPSTHPARYALPPNAIGLDHVYLQDFGARVANWRPPRDIAVLSQALGDFVSEGGVDHFKKVTRALDLTRRRISLDALFNSPIGWEVVQRMYASGMPYGSFLHFFWAWRALLGGLLATLEHPLPRAKVYHTISTGYAGVLAARAALETGRPVILTEHGIYTNERRIELLMADWVADTVDKGHALADPRLDLRDMWIRAFEAYARTCYEAVDEVVTLFEDNQRVQRMLGATPGKLRVIANGIDLARFEGLPRASRDDRPTMALIGRVVPIKDVKSYITAAGLLRRRVPDLRAQVIGPVDEDPPYYEECRALAAELGLEGCVEFTGAVNIVDHLPKVHVAVLTSLSESQPLVVLEAGAAGIPFVATNVGSCREIIEGRKDESPHLGPGGMVTDLVSPGQIADAVEILLTDHGRRVAMGEALRARVARSFTSAQAAGAYARLYGELIARPARQSLLGGGA